MLFLYNLGIFFYVFGVRVASILNPKAKKWLAGQKGIFNLIHDHDQNYNHPFWFHCASVGEFEQGYPLMLKLKDQYSNANFVITFFSPSGYEYVSKRYKTFSVYYLPIDTPNNAKKFLDLVKPRAAFFIKYEFWFHYLTELKTRQIPTFLVSGIFRSSQPFFKWYGNLHRKMLKSFTYLFVQNEESRHLLHNIGIEHNRVFGDTRFDRVLQLKGGEFSNDKIDTFINHSKVFIAGSVWASDENALSRIIQLLPSDWKIIIAPHEIDNYSTKWLKEGYRTYSNFTSDQTRILILDTMGMLSKLYRIASLVYIGGGYGKGIHNILEAAIYEIPILIGPKYLKFNEAVELIQEGVVFNTQEKEVDSMILELIHNDDFYQIIKRKLNFYMSEHTNVSEKILVFLNESKLLKK